MIANWFICQLKKNNYNTNYELEMRTNKVKS